jgi:hypothetical protein
LLLLLLFSLVLLVTPLLLFVPPLPKSNSETQVGRTNDGALFEAFYSRERERETEFARSFVARIIFGKQIAPKVVRQKNAQTHERNNSKMYRNATKFREHLAKLPEAMMPTLLGNKKWRKPEFSSRRVAELRKKAMEENVEWTFDKPRKVEKFPNLKPMKGHKRLREEQVKMREMKLKAAEKRQEEVMEQYRARKQRRAKGNDAILDEIFLTRKEKTLKMRTLPDSQKK